MKAVYSMEATCLSHQFDLEVSSICLGSDVTWSLLYLWDVHPTLNAFWFHISVKSTWSGPFFFFILSLFIFERERVHTGQRGGERIPSSFCTVSVEPDAGLDVGLDVGFKGLELTTREIMTWAETKCWMLDWLSHPGTLVRSLLRIQELSSNDISRIPRQQAPDCDGQDPLNWDLGKLL